MNSRRILRRTYTHHILESTASAYSVPGETVAWCRLFRRDRHLDIVPVSVVDADMQVAGSLSFPELSAPTTPQRFMAFTSLKATALLAGHCSMTRISAKALWNLLAELTDSRGAIDTMNPGCDNACHLPGDDPQWQRPEATMTVLVSAGRTTATVLRDHMQQRSQTNLDQCTRTQTACVGLNALTRHPRHGDRPQTCKVPVPRGLIPCFITSSCFQTLGQTQTLVLVASLQLRRLCPQSQAVAYRPSCRWCRRPCHPASEGCRGGLAGPKGCG